MKSFFKQLVLFSLGILGDVQAAVAVAGDVKGNKNTRRNAENPSSGVKGDGIVTATLTASPATFSKTIQSETGTMCLSYCKPSGLSVTRERDHMQKGRGHPTAYVYVCVGLIQ